MTISLSAKFYLTLVPLLVMGLVTAAVTRASLRSNSQDLIAAKDLKELAVESLALQIAQNDASKALLLDMENASAAQEKIQAYDQAQAVFEKMGRLAPGSAVTTLLHQLKEIDEKELQPLDTKLLETMGEGKADQAKKLYFGEYQPIQTRYEKCLRDIVARAEESAQSAALEMASRNRKSFMNIVAALASGIAVFTAVLVIVTRRTGRQLDRLVHNLRDHAQTAHETGSSLQQASRRLSENSSHVAASLQQTGASLEEVAGMTQQNAQYAETAKQIAAEARTAADGGYAQTLEMSQAMDAIQAASGSISKIIKSINEIAFQTNILALNAAVEAARAGEAGMGFAVVADEVRNLAQRSADAARETAEGIEDTIRKSHHGAAVSAKVTGGLKGIVEKIRSVDDLISQIAAASREQSQGISQLNGAVGQIDHATQNNAASASDGAIAAERLTVQGERLEQAIVDLNQMVHGTGKRPKSDNQTRPSAPAQQASIGMPENGTTPAEGTPSSALGKTMPAACPIPASKERNGLPHDHPGTTLRLEHRRSNA